MFLLAIQMIEEEKRNTIYRGSQELSSEGGEEGLDLCVEVLMALFLRLVLAEMWPVLG